MFSEVIAELRDKGVPEPDALRKRFDFAMTKKLGTLKLPPAFWTGDPKINPRSDHLFWASLLLRDRQRIDMALTVMEMELMEKTSVDTKDCADMIDEKAAGLVQELLAQFTDISVRQEFEEELRAIIPEWFRSEGGNHGQ